ncbi:Anucleate primary sterigmata protein B [Agyrium rufum]|nr:Anucleate primary sterigmata protein B [Agyrium rufum]
METEPTQEHDPKPPSTDESTAEPSPKRNAFDLSDLAHDISNDLQSSPQLKAIDSFSDSHDPSFLGKNGAKDNREESLQEEGGLDDSSFLPDELPDLPPLTPDLEKADNEERVDTIGGLAEVTPLEENRRDEQGMPKEYQDQTDSPPTPPEWYMTPAVGRSEETPLHDHQQHTPTAADHANTSSFETMSSSPTAAAAARTVSRIVSQSTTRGYQTADEEHERTQDDLQDTIDTEDHATPTKGSPREGPSSMTGSPTPTRQSFDLDKIDSKESPPTPSKRPSILTNRYHSHKSSYSSYTSQRTNSTEAASDATMGAEYALQTGGAAPFGSSSRIRPGADMPRSISMLSAASSLSDHHRDKIRPSTTQGTNRDPEQFHYENEGSALDDLSSFLPEDLPLPETPRGANQGLSTPTETIIAQHVRDVRVPATIARGFRDRFGTASPDKMGLGQLQGNHRLGKDLSLKEQIDKIDTLIKENWDLRLKITFLDGLVSERNNDTVKDTINQNVELRTQKVNYQKQIRELKRTIRELEQNLKEQEDRSARQAKEAAVGGRGSNEDYEEITTEVHTLRRLLETSQTEITSLVDEQYRKDGDLRRSQEIIQELTHRRGGTGDIGVRDEMMMWKEMYETENFRLQEAEEDCRALREKNWKLRHNVGSEVSQEQGTRGEDRDLRASTSSVRINGTGPERGESVTSTLVEYTQYQNAQLHRELNAQMSMIETKSKEIQHLYGEIEQLRSLLRRDQGRSVMGDSILERSASRAHGRAMSQLSETPNAVQPDTYEIEELEAENEKLKGKIDKLQAAIDQLRSEVKAKDDVITDQESQIVQSKTDYDTLEAHALTLIRREDYEEDVRNWEEVIAESEHQFAEASDRADILQIKVNEMTQEALHADDAYRAQERELVEHRRSLDQQEEKLVHLGEIHEALEVEYRKRTEELGKLSDELEMSQRGLAQMEKETQAKIRRIQDLELEVEGLDKDVDDCHNQLRQANKTNDEQRSELQTRMLEISIIRNQQEDHLMKIGDHEAEIESLKVSVKSEQDHAKDLENRLADERHQQEIVGSKEKQEVQKAMNELNREAAASKEDARKLKKTLETREIEVRTWKERLAELEVGLRDILGDPKASKTTFISSIAKLQHQLETTSADLKVARNDCLEKEHQYNQQVSILENQGLEIRRLSELLDKEKQGRRADKAHQEQWQRSHQHSIRTISQKESRITELESGRQADKKKISTLENIYKDSLAERNNLLLALWHRLSTICGTDWQHQNNLINGHLPTLEVVANMLPSFSKNLLLAVKSVESIIAGFKTRIRSIERDFAKDFQALEHNLDMRIKRLDRLESAVQVSRVSGAASGAQEIAKLRGENRMLKAEIQALGKADLHARTSSLRASDGSRRQSSSGSVAAVGPERTNSTVNARSAMAATLMRHHSTTAVEVLERAAANGTNVQQPVVQSAPIEPSQQRWIHRLRELERRLKAEREARLLDRSGARKRLEEGRLENEELRQELERERIRRGGDLAIGNEGRG